MKRPHPIYGTEIDKPPAELIEGIRDKISNLRGQIHDIQTAYPLWKDQLEHSCGGLTCVLVSLYATKEEMEKHQAKWGHTPDWLKDKN